MKKIIASLIMLANIPTVFAYQPEQFSLTINGNIRLLLFLTKAHGEIFLILLVLIQDPR